jgi:hypothetical protein
MLLLPGQLAVGPFFVVLDCLAAPRLCFLQARIYEGYAALQFLKLPSHCELMDGRLMLPRERQAAPQHL